MTFVNLHVHTNYSWDSTSRIKDIVSFAKKNNQPAIAMTDHGNMSGAIEFYKACKDAKVKPIIGCEFYICKEQMSASEVGSHNKSLNHLVVLAKNEEGYKNLLYLTKYANENFYYRPRIDEETLFANSKGLIVINGHMDTSINDCLFYNEKAVHDCQSTDEARQYLFPDYKDRLRAVYDRYYSVFGEDFYLEVQLFDKKDIFQQTYGHVLYEYAKENNFKCVGTGDAHYIKEEDAIFHKTFCAISMNTKIKDMSDIRYYNSGQYKLITNDHAEDCYPQELIEATLEVVNKIDEYSIIYPESVPTFSNQITNPREYIYSLCQHALEVKSTTDKSYQERLQYELDILEMGDLFNYFLIVYDFCKWAKDNNILMGPARGSAGGCLVSYLLGIIEMDPIKYGLLFERFYSPDRAKYKIMPDIDSDFPASKRSLVIDYIKNKYGHDYVKSVVTFSTLQGRNALKDVLRVHGAASFQEINNITENIPSRDKISDKLADFKKETGSDSILYYCLKHEPDLLKDYCRLHVDENGIETLSGEYAKYINIAIHLEGAIKSESKHASALIISKYPIHTVAPLIKDKSSDELMVGYDMDSFPHASLVKFDILGVKSFDCLMEVNELLKEIGL